MNLNLAVIRLKMPLLLAALAVFAAPVRAEDVAAGPINVQASLASSTITQGEPIMLNFKIINASNQKISTDMGVDEKDWLEVSMADNKGKAVLPLADPDLPQSLSGIKAIGGDRLYPKQESRHEVVVSQRFQILKAGTYRLSVRVRLPYGLGSQADDLNPLRLEQTFGTVFTKEYSFPVVVLPRDSERLRAVAKALQESMSGKDLVEQKAVIDALFSMPEAEALPSWQALVRDPRLDSFSLKTVASQLSRLNSAQAINLLAEMTWNPAQSPAVRRDAQIGLSLTNMRKRRNLDPALKRQIEKHFEDHGIRLSDQPDLPEG